MHPRAQVCGNRTLEKLDLSSNGISDAGMRSLSPALSQLAYLADLNLASNHLTLSGMVDLFSALHHMDQSHSTPPDLHDIGSRDGGAYRQASALLGLERLDLSDNYFGDLGALCVALGLSGVASVQSVRLSHCQVHLTPLLGIHLHVFSSMPPCFSGALFSSLCTHYVPSHKTLCHPQRTLPHLASTR